MQFRYAVLTLSIGLTLGSLPSRAIAHGFIIDQECPLSTLFQISIRHSGVVLGQQFVPQMSSLDVVEVAMGNSDFNFFQPATVAVRIHLHTIDGSVLATSNAVVIPVPATQTWQHFDFASSVALVPGELYVMEFIDVGGTGNAMVIGGANGYAPGDAVLGDEVGGNGDFSFREGPVSPVPARAATWGSVKALFR